jgi:RNA polymerase sigma-70 factor (ECF subfamily)
MAASGDGWVGAATRGAMNETDAEGGLLADAQRGDERAFLTLYHRHRTRLFRFAWRLTGSPAAAEDVTQECFLVLLSGAGFDDRRGPLRTYLFGVVRHLAMKRVRLTEREEEVEDSPAPAQALDGLLAAERAELIAQEIAALPPLQREALILFEYEDQSLEAISTITGADTGAVKARLFRARERLRKRLAPLMAARTERKSS